MVNPKYGKEVFAWVVDDPTGEHGIPATQPVPIPDMAGQLTLTAMPLITTQRHVAEKMRVSAERVVRLTGQTIQLLHFKFDGVIDEVKP